MSKKTEQLEDAIARLEVLIDEMRAAGQEPTAYILSMARLELLDVVQKSAAAH